MYIASLVRKCYIDDCNSRLTTHWKWNDFFTDVNRSGKTSREYTEEAQHSTADITRQDYQKCKGAFEFKLSNNTPYLTIHYEWTMGVPRKYPWRRYIITRVNSIILSKQCVRTQSSKHFRCAYMVTCVASVTCVVTEDSINDHHRCHHNTYKLFHFLYLYCIQHPCTCFDLPCFHTSIHSDMYVAWQSHDISAKQDGSHLSTFTMFCLRSCIFARDFT